MPTENTSNTETTNTTTQQTSETPVSYESWYETQSDDVRKMIDGHLTGLRNTVKATRQERDGLAEQIKELLPKAEKGSELEKSLTDISSKLEQTERRAAFAEEATKPEIGCRNPKAAYLLAVADNLFDKRGNPDWDKIKAAAPELFGAPAVNANAGSGTGQKPPQADMNTLIRRQTGRS
jgi:hypothetical protein